MAAAHFSVCKKCHRHGRIIFADGSKSSEICSIEAAIFEAGLAHQDGKLSKEEIPQLWRQIDQSGLAESINLGDVLVAAGEAFAKIGYPGPTSHRKPDCMN